MKPDDLICYCHHITLRKLANFARRERPRHAVQMSDCLGAGTGCGWCIPFLERIAHDPDTLQIDMTPKQYAAARRKYRSAKTNPDGPPKKG